MKDVIHHDSVHARIAGLLKSKQGEWVDSDLIEFVANFQDYQTDWPKRLRELRYLGLKISTRRRREGKRERSYYRLENWVDLPENPSQAARAYEQERAKRNRKA